MGTLQRFNLALLKKETGLNTVYETGAGQGDSLLWANHCGIAHLHSIEQDAATAAVAQTKLKDVPGAKVQVGDSLELITTITPSDQARLIFLDAHFVGGVEYKLDQVKALNDSCADPRSYPLLGELQALAGKDLSQDWIIIADAWMYVDGRFGVGECPEWARQWARRPELDESLKAFSQTHDLHLLRQDHGYFVLMPKNNTLDIRDVVRVIPGDRADAVGMRILPDVPGVTSISILRRIADHRFAARYFVGQGLDVGGGKDSLVLFQEFFPLIKSLTNYDMGSGDAQMLKNVDDNAFDFLYSSHCLEHMRDARIALNHWIRVVKPGGHLVIQAPDEDLYEQGVWPSRFNGDHKMTFTMHKDKSWSPVSINVLDMLLEFTSQVQVISVGLMDQGYRYGLKGLGFDQTRTPLAECGIEFVLRKL